MSDKMRYILRKVPEITIVFWIVKLLTTALGESTSDFLVYRINPYLAVSIGATGLMVSLIIQLFAKKYIAWIYWLAIIMVAIFGTMAADVLHIGLGVPYLVSTIFFIVALSIIFFAWFKIEKTLSIHSITSLRREFFYWATVMATFALGTAAGDMTAFTLNLGYFMSILLFLGLILIIAVLWKIFKFNSILTFWLAYILTRPLGASIADWAGKPQSVGGIGLGDGVVSLALLILIVLFIAYMTFNRQESRRETRIIR